jgi:hypothetical protein
MNVDTETEVEEKNASSREQSEENNTSVSTSMDTIDRLTFELLVNKSHYKKYLSKSNPDKFREHSAFYEKIRKYKNRIVAVVSDLTMDPELQINNEMNDGFNDFMRTCIRFFEMKDLETDFENKDFDDDSENMLFGQIADTNTSTNNNDYSSRNVPDLDVDSDNTHSTSKSWWGGEQVKKISKNMKYSDNFDMRMFSNM